MRTSSLHPYGKVPSSPVISSRQCQSVQSIIGSTLHPHQRFSDGAEHPGGLVAAWRPAETVQPVRDPNQCGFPMSRGQHAQHLHHDHSQGLCQPVGRQHGRRTRQARGRA